MTPNLLIVRGAGHLPSLGGWIAVLASLLPFRDRYQMPTPGRLLSSLPRYSLVYCLWRSVVMQC
jgi:hypothetical protein